MSYAVASKNLSWVWDWANCDCDACVILRQQHPREQIAPEAIPLPPDVRRGADGGCGWVLQFLRADDAMKRVRLQLALTLLVLSGCAYVRSFKAEPVAAQTVQLVGFSYDPAARRLNIYREAPDDLIVCIPPPWSRYQDRGPACSTLRDLRGYLYSLEPATP